jgi:predicted XRE-type DNA-binding protein
MTRKRGQRFKNVWDALEKTPGAAMRMTIRSKLVIAISSRFGVGALRDLRPRADSESPNHV